MFTCLHESTYYRRKAGRLAHETLQGYVPDVGKWVDVEA